MAKVSKPYSLILFSSAALQILKRNHDMFAIGRSIFQSRIPAFHIRQFRAFERDLHFIVTEQLRPCRNVAHGEIFARDELLSRKMLVDQLEQGVGAHPGVADHVHVPLVLRRAPETRKSAHESVLQIGQRPVDPHVGLGAFGRVFGPQPSLAVFRADVTHDRMGFPDNRTVVVDHRNARVGIHRAELRRLQSAEWTARVDTLMHDDAFAHGPHRLLHVDGVRAAPDLQHHMPRFNEPPLPNSSGLRLSMTRRLTPIHPISPDRRPYSIFGQRSMMTVRPAALAFAAASSLMMPSCIQTTLTPRRSFSASASSTMPSAALESRKMSTMSTGAGTSLSDA